MGAATNSRPIMAPETKDSAYGELAGCTRFFATFTSTTGC